MATCRMPGPTQRGVLAPLARRGVHAPHSLLRPGPVGGARASAGSPANESRRGTPWVLADVSAFTAKQRPPAGMPTMVRIAHVDEPEGAHARLQFDSVAAVEQALQALLEHRGLIEPFKQNGPAGPALIGWLAGRVQAGEYRIVWRPLRFLTLAERETPPQPRPAPAPVWVAPPPKAPDYSTFPPELDAAAMASVLMQAAADGVPFCEECQKAAQQGAA